MVLFRGRLETKRLLEAKVLNKNYLLQQQTHNFVIIFQYPTPT